MWFHTFRQRGVPGWDIVIATVAGAVAIGGCGIAISFWAHGDKAEAIASGGIAIFIAATILFKLFRPQHGSIVRETLLFFAYTTLVMWIWLRNTPMPWKAVCLLAFPWFGWRVVFHIRSRRLNRKISRNLSRMESLTRGPRTGTACKRLSPRAILRFMAVYLSLLLLMVLRYWHVGDRVSGIALAIVSLYVGVNTVLRFLDRRKPPGEAKEFRDRHMCILLAISAIQVAIFAFVAIRSWQRDGSLFWSALCWTVSLIDACISTLMAVMYFRSKGRMGATATQIT
jgi:hypothetical protein